MWLYFRNYFEALRPKINHFRIHKKCYFPVKFVVSLIIYVHDCRHLWKLGSITKIIYGKDNKIRGVELKIGRTNAIINRPENKL